jgi:hypothetical protein
MVPVSDKAVNWTSRHSTQHSRSTAIGLVFSDQI